MILVISRGIGQGRRVAFATAVGCIMAGVIQIPLLALGLASIINASPIAHEMLRWGGALYLTYLGARLLIGSRSTADGALWVRRDAVKWIGARPKAFRSSPIAVRSHCDDCGTPIYLAYDSHDEIAFAAGAIENAESLVPTHHYGVQGQLSGADIGADLPKQRSQETW